MNYNSTSNISKCMHYVLFELPFLGRLGIAAGKDDVPRNAKLRRRIRTRMAVSFVAVLEGRGTGRCSGMTWVVWLGGGGRGVRCCWVSLNGVSLGAPFQGRLSVVVPCIIKF